MPTRLPTALVALCLIYVSSACALGTTRVDIATLVLDSSENPIAPTRSGDLLVRRFVDRRPTDQREFVGAKRNGYGMVLGHLGVVEGTTLPDLITNFIADALSAVGYRTAIEGSNDFDTPDDFRPIATVEGAIETFWLDMYMATWHQVGISVSFMSEDESLIWEGLYEGEETNVLWLGISSEFEKVIRQALDKALIQAVEEFASDELTEQLQRYAFEISHGTR